ncbi:hypothetical protein D3C75_1137030 [compost metagenome]
MGIDIGFAGRNHQLAFGRTVVQEFGCGFIAHNVGINGRPNLTLVGGGQGNRLIRQVGGINHEGYAFAGQVDMVGIQTGFPVDGILVQDAGLADFLRGIADQKRPGGIIGGRLFQLGNLFEIAVV